MKHSKTPQKIDEQLLKIEGLINSLLENIKFDELTAEKRLNLATKFMAIWQRGIAIRQTCVVDQPENRETMLIAAFMRQMRGESSAPEVLRIVEEEAETGEEELE